MAGAEVLGESRLERRDLRALGQPSRAVDVRRQSIRPQQ